jgi:hypothetical protein
VFSGSVMIIIMVVIIAMATAFICISMFQLYVVTLSSVFVIVFLVGYVCNHWHGHQPSHR